ncbi:MAG TPA: hypothetical protein PKH54_07770, partial [Myxococcota bacterium]|nr:hypothetical protein [Myxococcota bacterium]
MPAVFPLRCLMVVVTTVAALTAGLAGCGGSVVTPDVAEPVDVVDVAELPPPPSSFVIMTFNVGTTDNMDHTYDEDGYDNRLAEINAGHFGN